MQRKIPTRKADPKQELRARMRAVRRGLSVAERRTAAFKAAARARRLLRTRRNVAIYLSFGFELGTGPLISGLLRDRHRLFVPRLHGQRMVFVPIDRNSQLRRNRHGILEPVSRQRAGRIDAVLLPLLAFDAAGGRLGQGGGHYDRALARRAAFRRPLRIGYGYSVQQLERVPTDAHDVVLHAIVTDREVRWRTG